MRAKNFDKTKEPSRGHRTRWAVGQVGGEKVAGGKWRGRRKAENFAKCGGSGKARVEMSQE